MNDRDCWTVDAMEKYGGSFVKALAELARHADASNLALIKRTWNFYWEDYELKGKELQNHHEKGKGAEEERDIG